MGLTSNDVSTAIAEHASTLQEIRIPLEGTDEECSRLVSVSQLSYLQSAKQMPISSVRQFERYAKLEMIRTPGYANFLRDDTSYSIFTGLTHLRNLFSFVFSEMRLNDCRLQIVL